MEEFDIQAALEQEEAPYRRTARCYGAMMDELMWKGPTKLKEAAAAQIVCSHIEMIGALRVPSEDK